MLQGVRDIDAELLPELGELSGSWDDLYGIVQACAEQQPLLRKRYTPAVGRFCLRAISLLVKNNGSAWACAIACLRLLEGVLLMCMTTTDEMSYLSRSIQELLMWRILPRQATARLETAVMCLSDSEFRQVYAAEKPGRSMNGFGVHMDDALHNLVVSQTPSKASIKKREQVFKHFDDVIFKCFGLHGGLFGSAVNGFQLKNSDMDVSVLLPTSVQEELLADAQKQRDTEIAQVGGAEVGDRWRFLNSKNTKRAASIAAARRLADTLRGQDFDVVEVVETARVPIVKCRYSISSQAETQHADDNDEREVEVDISFCNMIASYNSRLLCAYAEFDPRARALGVLVKLWAKRRGINSPLEGTLSSYSYTLMVIHYLQRRGLLPNLQQPDPELLSELQCNSTQELVDGLHNVWFLDPLKFSEVSKERWLGAKSPEAGLFDLLYGFFRYFVLDFNFYSEVVSIRLGQKRLLKLDFFAAEASEALGRAGSDAGEEDEIAERDEAEEDETSEMEAARQASEFRGCIGERITELSPALRAKPHTPVDVNIAGSAGMAIDPIPVPRALSSGSEVADEDVVFVRRFRAPSEDNDASQADPQERSEGIPGSSKASSNFVGTMKSFSPDHGFGFIECPATHSVYNRDVFLHQKQMGATGLVVGDRVQFSVELNARGQPQARNVLKVSSDEPETLAAAASAVESLPRADQGSSGEQEATSAARSEEAEDPRDERVQKWLNDRQCLCIDDPIESQRTLGTSFSGQEHLIRELRRALSILKKDGDNDARLQELIKAKDSAEVWPGPVRDFSPIPVHTESQETPGQYVVHFERYVPRERVGLLVGHGGKTLQNLRSHSGVEDLQINDNKGNSKGEARGKPSMVLRGKPKTILSACAIVDQILTGPKQRRNGWTPVCRSADSTRGSGLTPHVHANAAAGRSASTEDITPAGTTSSAASGAFSLYPPTRGASHRAESDATGLRAGASDVGSSQHFQEPENMGFRRAHVQEPTIIRREENKSRWAASTDTNRVAAPQTAQANVHARDAPRSTPRSSFLGSESDVAGSRAGASEAGDSQPFLVPEDVLPTKPDAARPGKKSSNKISVSNKISSGKAATGLLMFQ